MQTEPWALVLAGGTGRRLARLTGGVPKQFWRPGGGPTLLEGTLARLAPLFTPEHIVVIVDQAHRQHVSPLTRDRVGTVLFQPCDRGTAAGVLMALMPVLDTKGDAVVLLTASDHGVRDVGRFRRGILDVVRRVRVHDEVVLFGAVPAHANDDYGWIVPGPAWEAGLRRVSEFVEKPTSAEARRLLAIGAAWNTMVMVVRAHTLRLLFAEHVQQLAGVFETVLQLASDERGTFLSDVYPTLASKDFSRDVLTRARSLLLYTWPRTLGWSDLGTPERLAGWLGGQGSGHPVHRAGVA